MLAFRFLLLSTLILFIPQSSCISISAQEWAMRCYNQMTPEELQLTANITYLLYANALIDTTIQQFFTPISRLTQSILYNMNDSKNPNNELYTLKTLIERLLIITRTRLIYTEMLNTCLAYYNDNETDSINNALENLQLYGREFMRSCANENSEKTVEKVQNCEKILTQSAQTFYAASGLHRGLSEGVLPFEIEGKDRSIATLSVVLNNAQSILNCTDTIINTFNDSCDHIMKVICSGTTIYKDHYQALYMIITSPSFDQQYATMLFDMYGLISPEYKLFLPSPDQMLEHILKTAKLYTQTEIVQL